jgi:hypothetical protein
MEYPSHLSAESQSEMIKAHKQLERLVCTPLQLLVRIKFWARMSAVTRFCVRVHCAYQCRGAGVVFPMKQQASAREKERPTAHELSEGCF